MKTPKKKVILYPYNWFDIAQATKATHDWQCDNCHIKHGEDKRNNLTVHHRDHNTFNNDPSNLQALCQKCHLREEGIYRTKHRAEHRLELILSQGQTFLPNFREILFSSFIYSRSPGREVEKRIE